MKNKWNILTVSAALLLTVILMLIWWLYYRDISIYCIIIPIILIALIPAFVVFEQKKLSARETALTATLIALAVVSRAVFYLLPQVKPIGAVVIASAVCLGAQKGYFIGIMSAFVSNSLFGQGVWTPFQMLALGLVGLLAGLLPAEKTNRWVLSLVGFVLTFALYGAVTDFSTVLMMYGEHITLKGLLSVYAAGVPFSLLFGASTAVFLLLFGKPFIKKVRRIQTKYID